MAVRRGEGAWELPAGCFLYTLPPHTGHGYLVETACRCPTHRKIMLGSINEELPFQSVDGHTYFVSFPPIQLCASPM